MTDPKNPPMTAERAAEEIEYRLRQYDMEFGPTAAQRFRDAIRALRAPAGEPVDRERVAQLIAHRACHGAEHDPLNGKLHGYCMVCGVPWPCEYAATPPVVSSPPSEAKYAAIRDELTQAGHDGNPHNPYDTPSPAEQGAREAFKVGDRVKHIIGTYRDESCIKDGDSGTVTCVHDEVPWVRVQWDDPNDPDDGGVWWIRHDSLRKLAPLAAGRVGVAVDAAMIERALAAKVPSGRAVSEYIDFGGRRFWSPSGWLENPRRVMRTAIEHALAGPLVAGEVEAVAWRSRMPGDTRWLLTEHEPTVPGIEKRPLVYADTAKGV
jgi:hypothetical protein